MIFCVHSYDFFGIINEFLKSVCQTSWTYPHTRIPAYPHIRIPAYPHIRISAYPHTRISAYPHTRISAYPHIRISAYPRTRVFHQTKFFVREPFQNQAMKHLASQANLLLNVTFALNVSIIIICSFFKLRKYCKTTYLLG